MTLMGWEMLLPAKQGVKCYTTNYSGLYNLPGLSCVTLAQIAGLAFFGASKDYLHNTRPHSYF